MNRAYIVVTAALAAVCSTGCMKQQTGRLYDMKSGQSSGLVIEHPTSSGGTVRATLPNGASCEGSFSEVSPENAKQLSVAGVPFTGNSEASVAMLSCKPKLLLRCTMARRPGDGFSYGTCTDPGGAEYSLMF